MPQVNGRHRLEGSVDSATQKQDSFLRGTGQGEGLLRSLDGQPCA